MEGEAGELWERWDKGGMDGFKSGGKKGWLFSNKGRDGVVCMAAARRPPPPGQLGGAAAAGAERESKSALTQSESDPAVGLTPALAKTGLSLSRTDCGLQRHT
eukprot:gene14091-biopygen21614